MVINYMATVGNIYKAVFCSELNNDFGRLCSVYFYTKKRKFLGTNATIVTKNTLILKMDLIC